MLSTLAPSALTQAEVPVVTTFIVLRHAEKSNAPEAGKDPVLSEAGTARANRIAQRLKNADIVAVYATQYRRTQLTAAPTARDRGLAVRLMWMGKRDLSDVADELKQRALREHAGRTILIIGHSNTVPVLVEALSGQIAAPMPETEFDRWSEVRITADGRASVSIDKYP